ncbi:Virulence-regulating protein VirS [Ruegeria denitrificans]|uniref:Virulence-regulating protein VirS n=1 Tax=Ruegeria denitrificans TaxID=1715692 RepID=A0A0P1I9D8_9RHOB|nr:AraC family transcriptional regulator [Ruegeria denitrificans]CUJ99510.1 Virulence-regulating protein VirS [Ruegeria denitrificans]
MALPAMISAKALGAMPQFVVEVAGEKRLAKAFDAADLPLQFVDERDGYISEYSLATFMHEAARSAGQQNIGLLWAPFLTVADYGAWGQYVLSAPKLRDALTRASAVMPFHSSTDRAWLETDGDTSFYYYEFGLRPHRAYADIGFSAIGVFLSIFRTYLGGGWNPSAVLLDFPKVRKAHEVEDTFGCPIIWNAPRLGVEFDNSCLQSETLQFSPKNALITVQDIARERFGGPPQTLRDQVAEIARQKLNLNDISIETAARALDLGVRTMQRKLEKEGIGFREIVNEVRINRATELLAIPSYTISGIASDLGYDAANNFSRAFKNARGISPTEYRKNLGDWS